ncbi:MAG: COX15/CtaA family protein [Candidatus Thiodiazotropha sp. (ex Dulcina madagascariensis)]|nr:COX15/CtaA family protein [Candidatus Thiodiazotropha sp. (ex Dulcina madagascariensis)]MCU7927199.1 COX15/CtaA family protein [Candidatus Thiodiazotropha sp. (ex Dulcina madagascariensis)]
MRNPNPSPLVLQYRLALFTCLLTFAVVLLGAYVRLSDAGLGCPDWPGCYGRMIVPSNEALLTDVQAPFPDRPFHSGKAWKEMAHRYLAGSLGAAILSLAILAWRRRDDSRQPLLLPTVLLALVILQAALGMWTVTLLVKPAIVTAHLLGGFATFVLVWLLALKLSAADPPQMPETTPSRRWGIRVAIMVLLLQISLGGWTSTNYAALACSEFPACYAGEWWPEMDFHEAFILWRGLGVNYEFGVLENDARTAIHMAHRLGALVTAVTLALLAWRLTQRRSTVSARKMGYLLLALLTVQIGFGITNVLAHLPLAVAVAHNGGAALLLLILVTLNQVSRQRK